MKPDQKKSFLIVGAGPTGLASALLLAKHGISSRIIEKRLEPSSHSKAFGVNPRTLELLIDTGVTQQLLESGRQMPALNLWRKGKRLFRLDLTKAQHHYPFMLIHSQAKSEALLAEALQQWGGKIERGVELVSLESNQTKCTSYLRHNDGKEEEITTSVVLGADGANSTVRERLGITFEGSDYDNNWYLYDVELETSLNTEEAQAFLLDDGAIFMLRIENNIWRVIGNIPRLLSRLPQVSHIGKIIWESHFGIAHRIAQRLQSNCAYLAGDAAHIHSGLGARGMNLGIEDAYVFAKLAATDQLQHYHALRHKTDYRVVRQVQRLTKIPQGKSPFSKFVRRAAPLVAFFVPLAARTMRKWILGLDHAVKTANSDCSSGG